jgi:protein tyrosine phosphatase (PTP) superfamily phosphohydrolase (DUF442 family)
MRYTDIKGFAVYNIFRNVVFQRGNLLKLSYDECFKALSHYGIDYVIGLARKPDNNLMNLWMQRHITYVYYPIPDGDISKEQYQTLHAIAYDATLCLDDNEGGVLSYCNAGRNRSGLMNALILWELDPDMSGRDALETIREERPNAIANPFFEQYLLDLES